MKHAPLSFLKIILCAGVIAATMIAAHAQPTKAGVDPSGTWIWLNPGRNGNSGSTNTLTLKYLGSDLTGTLKTPARGGKVNTAEIADGKLDGSTISFNVTRTFGTNTAVISYTGTVDGETIKGTSSTERNGEKRSRKWEAKREANTAIQ